MQRIISKLSEMKEGKKIKSTAFEIVIEKKSFAKNKYWTKNKPRHTWKELKCLKTFKNYGF